MNAPTNGPPANGPPVAELPSFALVGAAFLLIDPADVPAARDAFNGADAVLTVAEALALPDDSAHPLYGVDVTVLLRHGMPTDRADARKLREKISKGLAREFRAVAPDGFERGVSLARWLDTLSPDVRTPAALAAALGALPDALGPDRDVNEAPDDPHRLARAVLDAFRLGDGPALAWYREEFHAWDEAAYRPDPAFAGRVVALVKDEVDRLNRLELADFHERSGRGALSPGPGRPPKPPVVTKVTRRLIADVLQALASMVVIDQKAEAPFWIDPRPGDPDPMTLLPAANGLVDLDAAGGPTLRPHTPRLFSTHALPYRYRPNAPPPVQWLRFLGDQWGDDPESMRELQKWFGYIITPEIDHQKILLLIGPPRSGRSTIKDVMTAIVGRRNVASSSPVALANEFGLEPLLGRTLAILGDVRTGDTHDSAVMLDRLLRISGCDPVEVNRKKKTILSDVLMRTRLVIISNEMPNIRDTSGAIVARYLPLCTPQSFEGREDIGIKKRLMRELPAILNWAIEGRALLRQDGRFVVPKSAEVLLGTARAVASPVAEFVAERCALGPHEEADTEDLWKSWQEWAAANGHKVGTKQLFCRNLLTATRYTLTDHRPRTEGRRPRCYRGISLAAPRF